MCGHWQRPWDYWPEPLFSCTGGWWWPGVVQDFDQTQGEGSELLDAPHRCDKIWSGEGYSVGRSHRKDQATASQGCTHRWAEHCFRFSVDETDPWGRLCRYSRHCGDVQRLQRTVWNVLSPYIATWSSSVAGKAAISYRTWSCLGRTSFSRALQEGHESFSPGVEWDAAAIDRKPTWAQCSENSQLQYGRCMHGKIHAQVLYMRQALEIRLLNRLAIHRGTWQSFEKCGAW